MQYAVYKQEILNMLYVYRLDTDPGWGGGGGGTNI